MHVTRDNVQSSPIKMYSLFSKNSKKYRSLVTGYVSGYTTQAKHHIKIICSGPKNRDSDLSEYINILHQLAISNFHPHGPVCLFLPISNYQHGRIEKQNFTELCFTLQIYTVYKS